MDECRMDIERSLSPKLWENDSGEEFDLCEEATERSIQFVGESRKFSFDEDCEILKNILINCSFDKLKGVVVWKKMAESFSNNRTYESLKGRFKTSILSKIDFYCRALKLPQDVIDNFHRVKIEMFPKHLLAPKKCDRRSYSKEDDKILIDFVFNVQRPHAKRLPISGNLYWRIASDKLNETHQFNRTWQSIKQRFKKAIIPSLHNYDNLYSSKHRAIAKICYLAFHKNKWEADLTKFNEKCDLHRRKLNISDTDDSSDSDSENIEERIGLTIMNYRTSLIQKMEIKEEEPQENGIEDSVFLDDHFNEKKHVDNKSKTVAILHTNKNNSVNISSVDTLDKLSSTTEFSTTKSFISEDESQDKDFNDVCTNNEHLSENICLEVSNQMIISETTDFTSKKVNESINRRIESQFLDLNNEIEKNVLISRILQPNIRSRVAPKRKWLHCY